MKSKIFVFSILLLTISTLGWTEDPVLPDNESIIPEGSSADYLIASQSASEGLVETRQAIEEALQDFVTVNGNKLDLNGQEYKFSHANNYYLFYKPDYMIDEIFQDAKSLGLNTIRTWGFCDGMYKEGVSFQPMPGVYDESGFLKMDYIINKARESGMKLIIPFVNNWDDFGGINQYVEWKLGRTPTYAEHDLFYADDIIKGWYRDYVSYFLNRTNSLTGIRYKDDPTILTWELGNEPRAYTDYNGSILNPWINEMAEYIKGIDSNHLLSTGIEGWYGYSDGVDFVGSQSSPYIDIATFHLFPDYYNLNDAQALQWIQDRVSDAHTILNKPVYIGEFGKMVDRDAVDARTQMKARDSLYTAIYNTSASIGTNGLGFWILYGDDYPDYDNFGVYQPADRSTCRIIKTGSALFVSTSSSGNGGGNGKPDKPGKNQSLSTTSTESIETEYNSTDSGNTQDDALWLGIRERRLSKKLLLEYYDELNPIPGTFEQLD
ncbi:MAG: hypothetical protein A2Z72_01745 [Omnitrophica bacterium RBG_13_46_9]|nr:MAG: hypothetical protein A2Z72_01745 [Omnitrophica bacterium RBG_13_46_9]